MCKNGRIYVLNSKKSDVEKLPSGWRPIEWREAGGLQRCCLVVEDLIRYDLDPGVSFIIFLTNIII